MSEPAIEFRGVGKQYRLYSRPADRLRESLHPFGKSYHRLFQALRGVTLSVAPGEILGVIGRNGAGKSTFLKILSGVLTPSEGTARVSGSLAALLDLGMGFNMELTGRENVVQLGTIRGYSRRQTEERLAEIVEFAAIGDFFDQPLKVYSNGMRARLGFAASMATDPDILVLDEVLAVGDELFKRKCFAHLEKLMKSGKTILISSHNRNNIIELCTRAVLFDRGELILDGPPNLVVPQFEGLLFAEKGEEEEIRRRVLRINADEALKAEYQAAAGSVTDGEEETPAPADDPATEETGDYLLPGLRSPLVTETSPLVGVDPPRLVDAVGREVNAIGVLGRYRLLFAVAFAAPLARAAVFCNIKSLKGLVLAGTRIMDPLLEEIPPGRRVEIELPFECLLLPQNYYVDIAVRCEDAEGHVSRLRVIDAFMFKVRRARGANYYGSVHLLQSAVVRDGGPPR